MCKQSDEAAAFQEFCKHGGVLSFSDFVQGEAPDFRHQSRPLGVELVSYHRDATVQGPSGSRLRRWEAQLDDMMVQAKDAFFATRRPLVHVFVYPRREPRRLFPKNVSTDLLGFVISKLAGESPTLSPSLAAIAEDITVDLATQFETRCHWEWVLANWVDVDPDAVQARLDEKEQKLKNYRTETPEVWLLMHGSRGLYVGGGNVGRWSTCGHVTDELSRTKFRSSFDRVYYFDADQRKCVRLTI
jgi:hypothetical protein